MKIRTKQEIRYGMSFIAAWKEYGFTQTFMIKFPNFPIWISIFALISSILAPIIRKFLENMIL